MREEIRTYMLDKATILNIIWDMMEFQHGKATVNDIKNGRISFRAQMYNVPCDYHFLLREQNDGCMVCLSTEGNAADIALFRAFSLMESLMAKPRDTVISG